MPSHLSRPFCIVIAHIQSEAADDATYQRQYWGWLPRVLDQSVFISPPSMVKSAPVTFPARSPARKTMRSATSSGVVNRPVAASAAACWATSSALLPVTRATVLATPSSPNHSAVETGPGLTVLTRILCAATSLESDLEKLDKAALAAL